VEILAYKQENHNACFAVWLALFSLWLSRPCWPLRIFWRAWTPWRGPRRGRKNREGPRPGRGLADQGSLGDRDLRASVADVDQGRMPAVPCALRERPGHARGAPHTRAGERLWPSWSVPAGQQGCHGNRVGAVLLGENDLFAQDLAHSTCSVPMGAAAVAAGRNGHRPPALWPVSWTSRTCFPSLGGVNA
jgi:hypothetical protein